LDQVIAVEVDQVVLRPSRRVAVGPISVSLEPSTFLALLGPNGSGKTTLLRGLVGLARFASGFAIVNDAKVRPGVLPPSTGAIIEEPRFLDWLTCEQNLSLATERTRAKKCLWSCLDRWGLADVANRPASGLSQGMRQRLGLARLDLSQPRVLLLDEPTNALDVMWQERLWEFVRTRRAAGCVVVVATHDLDAVVTGGASRCLVLADGQLAADFDIDEEGRTPTGADARQAARNAVTRTR
jgi:ABC-2 type transport system ATP-binding protein